MDQFFKELIMGKPCVICGEFHPKFEDYIACVRDMLKKPYTLVSFGSEIIRRLVPEITRTRLFFAEDLWIVELFTPTSLPLVRLSLTPYVLQLPDYLYQMERYSIVAKEILRGFEKLVFDPELPVILIQSRDTTEFWAWAIEKRMRDAEEDIAVLREFPQTWARMIEEWREKRPVITDEMIELLKIFKMLPGGSFDPYFENCEFKDGYLVYRVGTFRSLKEDMDNARLSEVVLDPYEFEILSNELIT